MAAPSACVRGAVRSVHMVTLSGMWQTWLVIAAWVGVAPTGLPAAGGVSTRGAPGDGSHAWIVLPDPSSKNEEAAILAHIAPRSRRDGAGAADGVMFPAVRLEKMAVGLAACDERVYLFFEPVAERDSGALEVLSVRAVETPIAGMYAYEPQGRLEAHRSLARMGGFIGAVGTLQGVLAVVRADSASADAGFVVSVLGSSGWEPVAGPACGGADGIDLREPIGVASVAGQPWILGRTGGGIWSAWTADAEALVGASAGQGEAGVWAYRALPDAPFDVSMARVAGVGPLLVAAAGQGSGVELWSLVGDGWVRLGRHESVGERYGLAALGDVARALVVWEEGTPDSGVETSASRGPSGVKVWEVSAGTGLVLHDGDAARRGPLSTQDFRALVALLVGATTAVLLFVVKVGDESGVLSLPPGVSLAATGRRVAASAVDVAAAVAGVWVVTGASPSEVVDVLKLTPGGMGVMGLVDLIVFGFVGGTLSEAVFGRTIGKAMAGCEVLPVVGTQTVDRRGLGLGRAAARNAVKWALPPAAMLGLFEPGGRHRGDVTGRTVVVERFEEDATAEV